MATRGTSRAYIDAGEHEQEKARRAYSEADWARWAAGEAYANGNDLEGIAYGRLALQYTIEGNLHHERHRKVQAKG